MITKHKITDIHFEYQEGYLPTPRHRKLRYRNAIGETSVEVTLLTEPDKDAPIAFRFQDWTLTRAMGKEYYGLNKDRVSKDIRIFNGNLYERDHNGYHCCNRKGWYSLEEFTKHLQNFHPGYSCELGRYPETKEEYQKAIGLYADNVILMKQDTGEIGVWIECGEPRYVYNLFGLGHNHGGTGLFIEQHYNSNIPNTHYFNALERDRAISAAVDAAMRRGDDQSIESIRMCEEIEVLIPEAVKVDPMREHGEGDPFANSLHEIAENTESPMEAGILAMMYTLNQTK